MIFGLYLAKTAGSSKGFLSSGLNAAWYPYPVNRHKMIQFKIVILINGETSMNSLVGIAHNRHTDDFLLNAIQVYLYRLPNHNNTTQQFYDDDPG